MSTHLLLVLVWLVPTVQSEEGLLWQGHTSGHTAAVMVHTSTPASVPQAGWYWIEEQKCEASYDWLDTTYRKLLLCAM
jgi:hypothetical protein